MKRLLFWLGICLLCTLIGTVAAYVLVAPRFPPGAMVADVPVGKLTHEEAVARLAEHWRLRLSRPITFSIPGTNEKLEASLWEAGLRLDSEATIQAAVEKSPTYRIPLFWRTKAIPVGECAVWRLDEAASEHFFRAIKKFERPRGRAILRYEEGNVRVVSGTPGRVLHEQAAFESFVKAAQDGLQTLDLPFVTPPPDAYEKALHSIRYELASKTTWFKAHEVSRSHNIKLAAQLLDGVVLLPGEVFSYNRVVGRRSADRGFRIAPIFVNGRHVPGIGGGVCQVSSTVYNAALLAGLKIRERHCHQLVVGYVPVGLDATVDFGNKDLKFENDTGGPIAILTEYKPGRITVRIMGSKPKGDLRYELVVSDRQRIPHSIREIPDPNLIEGQRKIVEKGGSGFRCTSWRNVYKGDHLVRKEFLGRSRYMPSVRIVRVGTAKSQVPTAAQITQSEKEHSEQAESVVATDGVSEAEQ